MHYLRALLKILIPRRYHPGAVDLYVRFRVLLYRGNRYTCPVCQGSFRRFLPYGLRPRPNAQCQRCGSLERHRLLWLYLKERTDFFAHNLRVLDVAPMPVLQQKWRTLANLDYLSVDIASPLAMVQMDITDMKLPEQQFDCILCYHVLEHIPDDRKAMQELFRVLKPGGWAIPAVTHRLNPRDHPGGPEYHCSGGEGTGVRTVRPRQDLWLGLQR